MHIAFLTTEYPILGMKCGGIGIFIKHLSHLIVKSETGVKVSVVYWGNKFTETVWDDGISVIPINQPHKSPFSSFINRRYLNKKLKVGSINSIFYFLHKAAEPFNCLEQDNLA